MLKYCKILNENGLVQLGVGCPEEYYIEIGMELLDVEQSEKDNQWYLSEKCPHYTQEELEIIEKENRYNEIQSKLIELDNIAITYIINKDNKALDIIKSIKDSLENSLNI